MKSTGRQREIRRRLRAFVPLCSLADFQAMEETALAGHLRHLPPSIATWQAVTSRIRHAHTEYDDLLAEGYEPDAARHFVREDINTKLAEWGCAERIGETAE